MILPSEELLTLSEAVVHVKERYKHLYTIAGIKNWTKRGLSGVTLEALRVGARTCTSREAIARFFDRVTEQKQQPRGPRSTCRGMSPEDAKALLK